LIYTLEGVMVAPSTTKERNGWWIFLGLLAVGILFYTVTSTYAANTAPIERSDGFYIGNPPPDKATEAFFGKF